MNAQGERRGGRMIQIAVCDDQKLVSEKIKEMILHGDENRYEVEVFSDGRALLNSGKTFDILFLDIDMPGLDGIETAKALRKSENHLYYKLRWFRRICFRCPCVWLSLKAGQGAGHQAAAQGGKGIYGKGK